MFLQGEVQQKPAIPLLFVNICLKLTRLVEVCSCFSHSVLCTDPYNLSGNPSELSPGQDSDLRQARHLVMFASALCSACCSVPALLSGRMRWPPQAAGVGEQGSVEGVGGQVCVFHADCLHPLSQPAALRYGGRYAVLLPALK